jgi:hypothetical protein
MKILLTTDTLGRGVGPYRDAGVRAERGGARRSGRGAGRGARRAAGAPLRGCPGHLAPLQAGVDGRRGRRRARRRGVAARAGEVWNADVVHLNQMAYAAFGFSVPVVAAVHSDVLSWWTHVLGGDAPMDEWGQYAAWVREGLWPPTGGDAHASTRPPSWCATTTCGAPRHLQRRGARRRRRSAAAHRVLRAERGAAVGPWQGSGHAGRGRRGCWARTSRPSTCWARRFAARRPLRAAPPARARPRGASGGGRVDAPRLRVRGAPRATSRSGWRRWRPRCTAARWC